MRYLLLSILFICSCSYIVGREYSNGVNYEVYPYVKVIGLDHIRVCGFNSCYINVAVDTTVYNPTSNSIVAKVKCEYFWDSYNHGSDTSRKFFLAPQKNRNIKFTYMMGIPFNDTGKVGVDCDVEWDR
jgi:hypothetical protein